MHALGFGDVQTQATLGQTLAQTIQLRLEPGDVLGAECVTADVTMGEQRVPPSAVRVRLDGSTLRVSTSVPIEEPVVHVLVGVGCPQRLSRRFVVFADPPFVAATAPTGTATAPAPATTAQTAPVPAPAGPAGIAASPAGPGASASVPGAAWPADSTARAAPALAAQTAQTAPQTPRAARRLAPPRSAAAAQPKAQTEPAARAARPVRPTRSARSAASAEPAPSVERPGRAADAPAVATGPRLRLDPVEPVAAAPLAAASGASAPFVPSALSIDAAASAAVADAVARATAEAASASADRIATLEKAFERLRHESAADREQLRVLRAQAAQSNLWSSVAPYLLGLVAALGALSAVLWLRLRRTQHEQERAWWNATALGATAADEPPPPVAAPVVATSHVAAATDGFETPEEAHAAAPTAPAALAALGRVATVPGRLGPAVFTPEPSLHDDEPPVPPMERTERLPPDWRSAVTHDRDVSIEELIDLEQQAEFFIVLGQDEAAIDLLVDHLRSTGGGSPMPYLKLLEIYRRQGDHEAYERTRARFNHRFNAYAPEWDHDAHEGRSLEDYPAIIARLQSAWPSPIDAMAELESLLFRKTRGELFDMPAYRDVLFLYALARDLADREPVSADHVDVLLPISEGTAFTQPMALEELPELDSSPIPLDNPPTVPVDLDVTQPAMPDSIFDDVTYPGPNRR